jgi:hypothetical protein
MINVADCCSCSTQGSAIRSTRTILLNFSRTRLTRRYLEDVIDLDFTTRHTTMEAIPVLHKLLGRGACVNGSELSGSLLTRSNEGRLRTKRTLCRCVQSDLDVDKVNQSILEEDVEQHGRCGKVNMFCIALIDYSNSSPLDRFHAGFRRYTAPSS